MKENGEMAEFTALAKHHDFLRGRISGKQYRDAKVDVVRTRLVRGVSHPAAKQSLSTSAAASTKISKGPLCARKDFIWDCFTHWLVQMVLHCGHAAFLGDLLSTRHLFVLGTISLALLSWVAAYGFRRQNILPAIVGGIKAEPVQVVDLT